MNLLIPWAGFLAPSVTDTHTGTTSATADTIGIGDDASTHHDEEVCVGEVRHAQRQQRTSATATRTQASTGDASTTLATATSVHQLRKHVRSHTTTTSMTGTTSSQARDVPPEGMLIGLSSTITSTITTSTTSATRQRLRPHRAQFAHTRPRRHAWPAHFAGPLLFRLGYLGLLGHAPPTISLPSYHSDRRWSRVRWRKGIAGSVELFFRYRRRHI